MSRSSSSTPSARTPSTGTSTGCRDAVTRTLGARATGRSPPTPRCSRAKYASEVGIHAQARTFDCPDPLLAEVLSDEGYTTRGFSANPNLSPAFEATRGFDEFTELFQPELLRDDVFDWRKFFAVYDGGRATKFPRALSHCLRSDCSLVPSLKHGLDLTLRRVGLSDADRPGAEKALQHLRETDFGDREFLFVNLMEAPRPTGRRSPSGRSTS